MEISPHHQNIEKLFAGTKFYIDFYQREYKWTTKEVGMLLDDVFYRFNLDYRDDLEPSTPNVEREYKWYYLNTYITNKADGKTFVVDGQQRLTTITLVLIALLHSSRASGSKLENWIRTKILGYSGGEEEFWMGHGRRKDILKALFDSQEPSGDGITAENMVQNYKFIVGYLGNALNTKHRLETFVYFFLTRLVVINLDVAQTDVAMVFEVINDRGKPLKSYEILKGKLLGQIDKNEVERFTEIWETTIRPLELWNVDLVDDFFRTYLKAKFAATRAEGRKFDGDYQRAMFEDSCEVVLKLKKNANAVKSFLENDFKYYARLYTKLLTLADQWTGDQRHVRFNRLTGRDGQVMLIIAACGLRDQAEDQKIETVSRLLDRTYVLLQLNKAYDSNRFTDMEYELSAKLKDAALESYAASFEDVLVGRVNERRGANISSPLQYAYFKEAGYQDLQKVFLRYFLARIELFISEETGKGMQDSLENLVQNTGPVNGYHVEHILSNNEENLALFDGDEEVFERERNRLGGLLLMRGRDNQSSQNEPYTKKLESYAGTLYWNQSLRQDFYKSKKDNTDFIERRKLLFTAIDLFDKDALERRSELLFEMVKMIWE